MKTTFDIANFFQTLGDDLFLIFERSSRDGIHPDEVRRVKEINIKMQLKLAFNSGMGIGRGFKSFDVYQQDIDLEINNFKYNLIFKAGE